MPQAAARPQPPTAQPREGSGSRPVAGVSPDCSLRLRHLQASGIRPRAQTCPQQPCHHLAPSARDSFSGILVTKTIWVGRAPTPLLCLQTGLGLPPWDGGSSGPGPHRDDLIPAPPHQLQLRPDPSAQRTMKTFCGPEASASGLSGLPLSPPLIGPTKLRSLFLHPSISSPWLSLCLWPPHVSDSALFPFLHPVSPGDPKRSLYIRLSTHAGPSWAFPADTSHPHSHPFP